MITKAIIKNFQSHKRTVIDLSKGINMFIGISDKGKTVIIRAIRWVVYNKPSGEEYRSWWGGETSVELFFSDGTIVKRVKSNTVNEYWLNGGKLKAFGQGVPDEITKILNLEEVNIQQQMDAPFLLNETAGEVASHFNKIAGISIIDKSIAKAKKEVAETKASIKQREDDLKEKTEQLEAYNDLDALEKKVKQLDTLDKEKKAIQISVFWLKDKVKRLKEINGSFVEMETLLELEQPIKKVLAKKKQVDTKEKEINKINTLVGRLQHVDEAITGITTLLQLEPTVNELLNKHSLKSQFQRDLTALTTLINKHTTLTRKGQDNDEKLVELIDAMPDVCPVCKGTGKLK